MKNSLAYILWIAFWNLWLENWTLLMFNFPGKCCVCSSSSCAKSYLTLASIFVHFISHERSWANPRSGDLLYNWHLRFWCPTSIFLPRKTMLLYLFREVTLVWLSITIKIKSKCKLQTFMSLHYFKMPSNSTDVLSLLKMPDSSLPEMFSLLLLVGFPFFYRS